MATKTRPLIKEPIDYKLAVAVSDRVNIQNVRLVESQCRQTPEAGRRNCDIQIDWNVHTRADKKNDGVLVFPTFKLIAFDIKKGPDKPELSIDATFVLIYKAERIGKLKQENFEAFGKSNGIYNAWPYWREYVQNTVARMGLPPLTIPVFRLLPPKQKTGKEPK